MASKPRYATDKTLQALMARLDDLEARVSSQTIAAGTVTAVDTTAGTAQVQVAGGAETTMFSTSGAPYLPQVGDKVMLHLSDGDAVSVAPRQMVSGDLQSKGYVPGSAGWLIDSGGNAEFNDVTVRGTIEGSTVIGSTVETAATGQRIFLGTAGGQAVMELFSGAVAETAAGGITNQVDVNGDPELGLYGPYVTGHAGGAILLRANDAFSPFTALIRSVLIAADQLVIDSVDVLGAWTQWTPALSGSWAVGSTGVNWQRWKRIGKTMHVRGRVQFNGSGIVFDGSSSLAVQEIATAQANDGYQTGAWVGQLGGASYCGIVKVHPTDFLGDYQFLLPSGINLGATSPVTMVATDFVDYSLTYEVA